MDGFLFGDRKTLWVDDHVWDNYPNRYRFTLAHEVGHLILHPQVFNLRPMESFMEWKEYVNSIPEHLYGRIEFQAYCFGGLILVPADPLERHVRETIRDLQATGLTKEVGEDFLWRLVEEKVANIFEVSSEVILRRINYDELRHKYTFR